MDDTADANLIEKLAQRLEASSLSDDDKAFWTYMLAYATPDMAFSMLTYMEEFPEKVQWASDILKRKLDALDTKDSAAWQDILADEDAALREQEIGDNQPAI
ncbi:hypothetical protein HY416_03640 [Candidatus Kaiserbacteria bacterium]|nr:hypothetical protein [Candidatus Kaiserbacteria bacterium]